MNNGSLAISSCWNSARHTDGYDMVCELAELGFAQIELSHGIRLSLVPGILRAVEEGVVSISSVHNFCPLPSGVQHAAPNFYEPTAGRDGERHLWMQYSVKTLDFARQVGAQHVVMHSGSVSFFLMNPVSRFEHWLDGLKQLPDAPTDLATLLQSPAAQQRLQKVLRKVLRREEKMGPRLTETYQAVVTAAEERGCILCIENREALDELPSDGLQPLFQKALGPPERVRYWHDTGHAQIKELMGVQRQEAFLHANQERLAGFHLHDVSAAGKDHLPPGQGTIDWKRVQPFFRPDLVYVLELSPRLSPGQVLEGKLFLEDLGIGAR